MRHGIDQKTHSQCQRTARRHKACFPPRGRNLFPHLPDLAGGAYRDRTDDPLLAKQVLSQLS